MSSANSYELSVWEITDKYDARFQACFETTLQDLSSLLDTQERAAVILRKIGSYSELKLPVSDNKGNNHCICHLCNAIIDFKIIKWQYLSTK